MSILLNPKEYGMCVLPTNDELKSLIVGSVVKLCTKSERFWACIHEIGDDFYIGIIENKLISGEYQIGDKIQFKNINICDIMPTTRERARIYSIRSLAMLKLMQNEGGSSNTSSYTIDEPIYSNYEIRLNVYEQCETCGKYAELRCTNCNVSWYCSEKCRQLDNQHTIICNILQSISPQRIEAVTDIVMRIGEDKKKKYSI